MKERLKMPYLTIISGKDVILSVDNENIRIREMDREKIRETMRRYSIVGNNEGVMHAVNVALQVAGTDLSVLITGESGVGKEIFPRIIHDNSPRRHGKYFAINCGSIPEGTIDSELFGHEKGSYTGAIGESDGYFGTANKGTIFLDEVGELPKATQARLLRVLETGEYIRVGGQEVRHTDVRIVAATNMNMRKAISEGRFREDLYYRLSTIPIQIPPLRERDGDVVLLFRHFAMQMAERYKLPGRITLTAEAEAQLMRYKWPGNVRQLKNITEQMSILSTEREITVETLRQFIPDDGESMMLAPIEAACAHSYESEREVLFKLLYDLKGNIGELRREINSLRERFASTGNTQMPAVINPVGGEPNGVATSINTVPAVQDAVAEEIKEGETLNLEDIGKQMVTKALERNGGNRREAARQLGISTRTLYRKIKQYGLCIIAILLLASCSVSYQFNGASIDYTKTKTIQISDFPNRCSYVWGPMASMFNEELKDEFANNTRLTQVKRDGDLKIEGEITQYQQRNKSVTSDGYSAQTELTMTVNVRFTNRTNHEEDFEQTFSASSTYETTQSLTSVQEDLVTEMVEDIVDQIFNATVANW